MFHKLHLQLTVLCTTVTGGIFLILTFLCLSFAENSLKANDSASFVQQLNATTTHIQEQNSLSHQWLNQIQADGNFFLYLYDYKTPLSYEKYHRTKTEEIMKQEALDIARTEHGMDIFSTSAHQIAVHTEFDFVSSLGQKYYASAGIIPRKSKQLGFLILSPLDSQQQRIRHMQIIICLTDLAAVSILLLFFWFFTKRMLIPLEQNKQKQMQFIASASHELRTPLSVLQSGLEVLGTTNNPDERMRCMDYMTAESLRMKHLIDDMLLLANSDSGNLPIHMNTCLPDEILISVYEKYESLAARHKLALSIHLPEELLPDILCDKERLIQVFSILIDNAISYTPAGGHIRLSLHYEKTFFLFQVTDSGCGVPNEEKSRIFDRFYRSENSYTDRAHFGLGLCIAKEIVTAHRGKIWVEDAPGGGSCFCVRIPG